MTAAEVPFATAGFALFDTPIGHCAIAWSFDRITGVQLPADAGEPATRARMHSRFPQLSERAPEDEQPEFARQAITAIQSLLQGTHDNLLHIDLDMRGVSELHRRIYDIVRRIPPGQTRTYGDIADELGDRMLSRAVGQAMGHNPFAPVVPCHRVLAAGNKPGGFSAGGGALTKLRMLDIEGARPNGTASLF